MSISIPFEELLASSSDQPTLQYDCLIIGSGYGGSVAAHTFSQYQKQDGEPLKIAVLERGKEYLPGSFPAGFNEAVGSVPLPGADKWSSEHDGLYDVRSGDTHWVLSGNGVGGGSLINAGVMFPPDQETMKDSAWPEEARALLCDTKEVDKVGLMLGSRLPGKTSGSIANTVENADEKTNKYHALASSGQSLCAITPSPLSIRLSVDEPNQAIATEKCRKCGNCFTGCNFNAKKSLDTNLLAEAAHNGVMVVNGAEVLFFEQQEPEQKPDEDQKPDQDQTPGKEHNRGWVVHVVYSSAKLRTTQTKPLKLYCDHLVISAGAVGSTELLLRSQYKAKRNEGGRTLFSKALGTRFYGNGDTISAIADRSQPVTMVADDATPDSEREIGPTNSGMLDFRFHKEHRLVFQELAVPGALQRVLIEFISFTQMREALTSFRSGLTAKSAKFLGLTKADVEHMTVVAGIGGDYSAGTISEIAKEESDKPVEDEHYSRWLPDAEIKFSSIASDISWKQHRSSVLKLLKTFSKNNDYGSRVYENPMESPLGDKLRKLFGFPTEKSSDTEGKLMSVHPLGGCVMADTVNKGVVNVYGQVYKPEVTGTEALSVTDSSTATDDNPLSIAELPIAAGNEKSRNVEIDKAVNDQLPHTSNVYENLAVIDGAIVPAPLDVNPALSIAVLALNASTKLAEQWGWDKVDRTVSEPVEQDYYRSAQHHPVERDFYRRITPEHRTSIQPTELTLAERLIGSVWLNFSGRPEEYIAELRLCSQGFNINQFAKTETLTVELLAEERDDCAGKLPPMSVLRLFRKADWDAFLVAEGILERRDELLSLGRKDQWLEKQRLVLEEPNDELDKLCVLNVPMSGTITIMEEVKTNAFRRICRGAWAWFVNRGWRDIKQSRHMIILSASALKAFIYAPSVFLHSGRERQLRYDLTLGSPTKLTMPGVEADAWTGKPVVGRKSFRYGVHTNPINQLMSIELSSFPELNFLRDRTLKVDLEYFAEVQVPLFQIHKESDAVTGYADLIAMGLWFARVSLLHYFWILRKPDTPREFPKSVRPAAPNREPKSLPGLASDVQVVYLMVADQHKKNKGSTFIRLSRFSDGQPNENLEPVLCIHGFSLGWSMFAHETLYGGKNESGDAALKGGLAAYLARKGHDVWVIDLRSSGCLPTAKVDWDFEEAAFIDIPVALEYISRETGKPKVSVVAHCMGAMKLSMLMMCSDQNFNKYNDAQDLHETRGRIGRIVLSQAGPFVRFSAANRLRERVVSVIKNMADFELQFEENPKESDKEAILDRLLNVMPYPEDELKLENPKGGNRFWVRGRHRMDAIYGKTFSLKNMDLRVMDRFHDFFGPLSFGMLEQIIWFSRRNQISNNYGGGYKMRGDELKRAWPQDTLWIHGEDNQLLDPMSPVLTTIAFDECEKENFTVEIIKEFGHQDCMMGKDCEVPYSAISRHLGKSTVA